MQQFPFPFSLIEFHWISIQFNWVWILLNFELNLVKFEFDSMLWNSISKFECSSFAYVLNWIWIQFNGIRISCNVFEFNLNSSYTCCHSIFSFKWNLISTKQLFFFIISLSLVYACTFDVLQCWTTMISNTCITWIQGWYSRTRRGSNT